MGVYLLGEENQESFTSKAVFSLIVINTFYYVCIKIQLNSKPKCVYVHTKTKLRRCNGQQNFLMQDRAIFMPRTEFLLKFTFHNLRFDEGVKSQERLQESQPSREAKSSVSNIYSHDHGSTIFLQRHNSHWVIGEYRFLSYTADAHRLEQE